MKVFTSALEDAYASGTTTLATALKIIRQDGEVFAFHTHDDDKTILGTIYSSDPGLVISDIVIAANCDVGNLQLTTLNDGTIFTPGDVLGGRWRNASFLIFRYDWSAPDNVTELSQAGGIDPLLAGTIGDAEIRQNMIVAELRDLRQYLQQPIGAASSQTCRYRLGDSRCGISLSDFTFTGTITHITSAKRVFRDSSRAEADDYFGEAEISFITGNAAAISAKVASYAANGTFTLALPLFVDLQVGDIYSVIAGDRKRLEDCRDKFDNLPRFGGEPHRRGINNLTASPDADA